MTRVKICGLTTEDDLQAAVTAGADAVGFICDVPVETPREVDPHEAATLAQATPPFVTSVLVTMPESVDRVCSLVARVEPDAVQLHTTLTPDEVGEISRRTNVTVVQRVEADDARVPKYAAVADALLVDSVDEQGAGGTGTTADWSQTAGLVASIDAPVVLAGGLTPENVATAIDQVSPFAVDVASGVETRPGHKDHEKLHAFVRATHRQVMVR
ncbi:phosphoribosylanthranilate isomerase [Haladaptatus sp. GCM10025707]|uniref:phosphoribosylanthranilate isomerase n=1 Tax=unclassified Haladaptatus TaxID=2622732 RepID=UPI0023E7667D|nr:MULTISPECIES: phosphoribosylanthranilate isomerase [unclassified Haladaptatus]